MGLKWGRRAAGLTPSRESTGPHPENEAVIIAKRPVNPWIFGPRVRCPERRTALFGGFGRLDDELDRPAAVPGVDDRAVREPHGAGKGRRAPEEDGAEALGAELQREFEVRVLHDLLAQNPEGVRKERRLEP